MAFGSILLVDVEGKALDFFESNIKGWDQVGSEASILLPIACSRYADYHVFPLRLDCGEDSRKVSYFLVVYLPWVVPLGAKRVIESNSRVLRFEIGIFSTLKVALCIASPFDFALISDHKPVDVVRAFGPLISIDLRVISFREFLGVSEESFACEVIDPAIAT